jgi:cell division protein FtsB
MKLAFAIALFLVIIFIGFQVVAFLGQQHTLSQNLSDVQSRLVQAQSQEADLQAETQYLSNPANLEKELRSQFNYKKPGETMIIIVPQPAPTSTP